MSRTAVVILNFNGEKLLRQFLPSVIRCSGEAEIVVADNASTDQSIQILKADFPTVRLVLLDRNYGFCGGYNRALKAIEADQYVLLNSDVEVTPGWLAPLTGLLEKDQSIAAVQPKILSYREKNKFEHAGAGGGFIDSLGYPFCRGRIFDQVETDEGQYDDVREIFWASGACMVIRSAAFHRFGGFDEDFFAHMEEIDLCWKLHRANQKVYYNGKSEVYHVGAGTLAYGNPRKTYLNFRNGLSLIYKHLPAGELIYKFPARIILDWVASAVFLLKGNPPAGKAVLTAHRDFFRNRHRDRQKRADIKDIGKSYSSAGIKRGLILFDYYILRKTRVIQ